MAEPNPTTSATNSDREGCTSNVPCAADLARAGFSRRQAMNMMTAVAAVPALAYKTPIAAHASAIDRSEWDRAVARLNQVEAEFRRIDPLHTAAFDAAEAACPRREEFFSRYNLGWYKDAGKGRERNFRAALMSLVMEQTAAKGRSLTKEEARQNNIEANRIVDEFDAYLRRRDQVHELHDCNGWEARFDAISDEWYRAREAVLRTEAPDHEAVLFKLELLGKMMDGEQDQPFVEAIRNDARRLVAM